MDKPHFAQTFVGAITVAALGGLIVWLLTSRQIVRVEVTNAGVIATAPELRTTEPRTAPTSAISDSATASPTELRRNVPVSCIEAVIDDPDGYTNVRQGPGINHDVVARVIDGEVFCITSQEGRWWTVRTASGVTGYIYYDRVRVIASQ